MAFQAHVFFWLFTQVNTTWDIILAKETGIWMVEGYVDHQSSGWLWSFRIISSKFVSPLVRARHSLINNETWFLWLAQHIFKLNGRKVWIIFDDSWGAPSGLITRMPCEQALWAILDLGCMFLFQESYSVSLWGIYFSCGGSEQMYHMFHGMQLEISY